MARRFEIAVLFADAPIVTRARGRAVARHLGLRDPAGECRLQWIERTAAGEVRHDNEPGVGALKQLWVDFLSILPFEWLL